MRARTVRIEKIIAANRSHYPIYQVQLTANGIAKTDIRDNDWNKTQPLTNYTLRAHAPHRTDRH